uniref:Uncharacterized protein n=1 Tax=Knipowitschia caucasica TaxID=637954 RepID=A0AAV2M8W3_KNICA
MPTAEVNYPLASPGPRAELKGPRLRLQSRLAQLLLGVYEANQKQRCLWLFLFVNCAKDLIRDRSKPTAWFLSSITGTI